MARRDRVPLTTPIARTTLKGWRIDPRVVVDIEKGTMSGSISFYDSAGKWVMSMEFSEIGNGDLNLGQAKIDNLADAIATKLINRDPTLAGTRIVDTVTSTDDPVSNP